MKNNKTILKSILILLAFISIYSCNKKDEPTPTPPPANNTPSASLTADKQNVNQLEIVTLTSQNITFTQSNYSGTIDGQNVILAVYQNKLGFQVPELAAGSYTLQTTVEGNSYSIKLNVAALAPIADPDTYLQTAIAKCTYSSAYLNNLATATAKMYGASDDPANITILNNYSADMQNKISVATPQEKAEMAKFVAANPLLFASLEDVMQYIDSLNFRMKSVAFTDDRIKEINSDVADRITQMVVITAAGATISVINLNPAPLYLAGFVVACRIYALNKYLSINLDKSLIQYGQIIIDGISTNSPVPEGNGGDNPRITGFQFSKGVQYTFDVSSAYRNLNKQDIGSSSSIIGGIVTSLNKFQTLWNELNNKLPTKLSGTPFDLKKITTVQTKSWKVMPSYLTIKNISNSSVTVAAGSSSGALKATFNSAQSTDQNFSFDLVYNNPNVSSSSTPFSATLKTSASPCANLKLTTSLSGKLVTASATGGTPPYSFSFDNSWAYRNFDPAPTFNLVYNGYYQVVVSDNNFCTDTVRQCINDVVIDNITADPSTPGNFSITYNSPKGLIPEFILYNETSDFYGLHDFAITDGDPNNYPPNISDWCNGISGVNGYFSYIKKDVVSPTSLTLYYSLAGVTPPAILSLRLRSDCNGWQCPGWTKWSWSNVYTVNW